MYIRQPTTFHTCKFTSYPQVTEPKQEPFDAKSWQARKNMREALEYPILMHIMEQREQRFQQRARASIQAHQSGAGLTISPSGIGFGAGLTIRW